MFRLLRLVVVASLATATLANAAGGQGDALPPGAVKRLGTLHFRAGGMGGSMVISPDGKLLVTSALSNVCLWDLQSGRLVHRLDHQTSAGALFFTPDSKALFTITYKVGLHVWEVATGKQLRGIEAGKHYLSHAALSPDGKTLALHLAEFVRKREDGTALHRSWIELRDARSNELIRKFAEFEPHFPRTILQFTPDAAIPGEAE